MKLYTESLHYAEPYAELFDDVIPFRMAGYEGLLSETGTTAAVLLAGGSDISPAMYGEPYAGAGHPDTMRDQMNLAWLWTAWRRGIPVIGICRGAQFINIFNKGSMIQHVGGHGTPHLINTHDGKQLSINSVHHQVMIPHKREVDVLAWATHDKVPEVILSKTSPQLGIQYHPEGFGCPKEGRDYAVSLVKKYIIK